MCVYIYTGEVKHSGDFVLPYSDKPNFSLLRHLGTLKLRMYMTRVISGFRILAYE